MKKTGAKICKDRKLGKKYVDRRQNILSPSMFFSDYDIVQDAWNGGCYYMKSKTASQICKVVDLSLFNGKIGEVDVSVIKESSSPEIYKLYSQFFGATSNITTPSSRFNQVLAEEIEHNELWFRVMETLIEKEIIQ